MTTDSVLLIDSDQPFVRVVSQVMTAGGYDVSTVSSALEAEALLAEQGFAAVILSLDVRDRDPEVFLRVLASDDRQPICILVTTHLDIQEMVRLYECGCVFNHRRKPLEDLGDLVRDLSRALEYRQTKRQNSYLLTQLRDARDEMRELSEFMVQVEKAATLGWVAQGLATDLEAALADAPSLVSADGSGRAMRTHSLSDLQQTLERCRSLVGDARATMCGPRGEFRPIDLTLLLASVVRLHRTTMAARGIDLEVGPVEDRLLVSGDGPNLRLVITALLQNAAQSMPIGGRVAMSLVRHGASAHLNIRDAGPGMATEVLSRAFDAFFTTRKMGEGTGLGLSVAKEIVHEHGGEIILASIEGEGTTAVVTLPVFDEAAEETPTESLAAAA